MTNQEFKNWCNWLADPANQDKQGFGSMFPRKNLDCCCALGAELIANKVIVYFPERDGHRWSEFWDGQNDRWESTTYYRSNEAFRMTNYTMVYQWNDFERLSFAQIAARLKNYRREFVRS